MKIYTIHTPSHQEYFDMFKGSLPVEHQIVSRVVPQVSESIFGSKDIKRFYHLKGLYILEALYREDEPFIFSDVDVYFFRQFNLRLPKQWDCLFQFEKKIYGFNMICSGFMVLKPNRKVKRMFKWVLKHLDWFNGDQEALNAYLVLHPLKINYEILSKEYYSINFDNGNKVWNGEEIKISVDPILFHYHWTIGDDNRMKLLEMVRRQVK